jgi:hypothetical protein
VRDRRILYACRMRGSITGMLVATALTVAVAPACSGGEPSRAVADHHDDGTIDVSRSALVATDPVSVAVSESCTTSAVAGLSTQLVEEIQCLRPGTLKRIDGIAGLTLGSAVFPYLQSPAVDALVAAQKARGTTMSINSALRTLAQQYLLYRWYKAGRCNIGLAAAPGKSNHESALAVDIADNAGWRTAMAAKEYRWLGSSDPVHFDFIGAGRVELRGLSVLAFQRLWNRNHPEDRIAEDSDYGPGTEERLAKSPVGGFAKGADCTQAIPVIDAGAPGEVPSVPDAPEGPTGERETSGNDGEGCSASGRPRRDSSAHGSLMVVLGAMMVVGAMKKARRRRPR